MDHCWWDKYRGSVSEDCLSECWRLQGEDQYRGYYQIVTKVEKLYTEENGKPLSPKSDFPFRHAVSRRCVRAQSCWREYQTRPSPTDLSWLVTEPVYERTTVTEWKAACLRLSKLGIISQMLTKQRERKRQHRWTDKGWHSNQRREGGVATQWSSAVTIQGHHFTQLPNRPLHTIQRSAELLFLNSRLSRNSIWSHDRTWVYDGIDNTSIEHDYGRTDLKFGIRTCVFEIVTSNQPLILTRQFTVSPDVNLSINPTERTYAKSDGRDGQYDGQDGQTDGQDGQSDGRDGQSDGRDGLSDGQDGQSDGQDGLSNVLKYINLTPCHRFIIIKMNIGLSQSFIPHLHNSVRFLSLINNQTNIVTCDMQHASITQMESMCRLTLASGYPCWR